MSPIRPVIAAAAVALPLAGCATAPATDAAAALEASPAVVEPEQVATAEPFMVLGAGDALGYAVYVYYLASRVTAEPVYAGVLVD